MQPLIPDRWKYIIAHDRGGNFDGTGKRAYHTEVGPRGQVWARDPNQQAPHAYNANREAFGVSATGQVGQMPGQQQLTSLKKYYEGSQAQDRERFGKGREWIGHGHAYERSKGQRNQASKDGRSTNEAAWLGAVTSNGSGTPGNPVQPWHNASGMEGMIDGGELSAANWTGAKGAAANPPLASPPRTLVASHTAGAAGIPSVSGPTPIQEHPQMERKRQGGFGNFANQLLNPMTMAGLSILSDGNVGKGFSQLQNARQQQSLMDFRNQEAERAQGNQQSLMDFRNQEAARAQGNQDRSFSATASHRKAMRAFQEQQAKNRQGNSDRSFGLQERRFGQQTAVNRSAMEGVANKRFGGVAQMIQSEQDPAKKVAMWQQMLAAHPGIAQRIPEEMRGDPVQGSQYAIALARGYQDPSLHRINNAKIISLEANAKAALAKANPQKNLASNIVGGLNRLSSVPSEYSRGEFENAVGTLQGNEQGGMLTGITRGAASLWSGIAGGASPTQIRSRIAGDTEALAAAIKPLIRGPGEGVWTDSDQARLVSVVGDLATANTPEDYNQRLRDVRERVQANFGMQLPEITFPGKKQNKNKKLRKLTPQQAMRLPPGTLFLTTDGRTARVPRRAK